MAIDGWVEELWGYIDHSLNYGQLVEDILAYVVDKHPEADTLENIAAYIDEVLTKKEQAVAGADALLPAVVLLLQALKDLPNAKEHKAIISKLMDGI